MSYTIEKLIFDVGLAIVLVWPMVKVVLNAQTSTDSSTDLDGEHIGGSEAGQRIRWIHGVCVASGEGRRWVGPRVSGPQVSSRWLRDRL